MGTLWESIFTNRKKSPSRHICLASIPLQTSEHLAAVARQASELGYEVCWLMFDAPESMSSAPASSKMSFARDESVTKIRTEVQFRKHLARVNPLAIFLQSPYPEHFPEWFWTADTQRRFCYSGYGVSLSTWEKGQYALPSLRACAWLLAESHFNEAKLLEYGNEPERVLLTGNPLMYELRRQLPVERPDAQQRVLMWAPHWSTTWFEHKRGYSRWEEAVHPLVRFATATPAVQIVVRPHPLLGQWILRALNDPAETTNEHVAAFRQLLDLKNVVMSEASLLEDILRSDGLLTDGVSIIAYFAATGRPMAVVRDAASPSLNEPGEALCAVSDTVSNEKEIADWLDEFVRVKTLPISAERLERSSELTPTWELSPIAIWSRALN